MTKPKVVFSPGIAGLLRESLRGVPADARRRARYYDEVEDFYALTRHEDVAAAFKDHESFSSAYGCDLGMVRSGEIPQKMIIFMDPPDHRHMRSLLNKAFTPRAIQAQKEAVLELVDVLPGQGSTRTTSMWCRTSPGRSRSR